MLRAPPAERLRDGIRVVLGGGPNTGKSTLFNALVGREAAIATPMPGTTRDMIEYPVQLDGVPFVFVDTAGLRESDDEIEQMGMSRARSAMSAADIVLWLDSPEKCSEPDRVLMVHARCDLPDRDVPPPGCIGVSAKTGTGMFELIANIVSRGTMLLPKDNELALVARQRDALHDCAASLRAMEHSSDILITAECLREARAALDRLTGHAGVEPLLDALFSRFCIGK
jgi:tRNA modification GTPase